MIMEVMMRGSVGNEGRKVGMEGEMMAVKGMEEEVVR